MSERVNAIRSQFHNMSDKDLARHLARVEQHRRDHLSPLHQAYLLEAADRLGFPINTLTEASE